MERYQLPTEYYSSLHTRLFSGLFGEPGEATRRPEEFFEGHLTDHGRATPGKLGPYTSLGVARKKNLLP